ncbi:cAMP-dependent protein kinase inhibitor beta isoform X1 [Mus caroli]|uniref:cAMP-dependent protein kinase inhibitor beta isoform X1 n=2 Tax=Mus caroli TaxID=10089 RepID=A0A6P5QBV0_MUSCR|nr:cAMP-dependent protein kinase inhibitor beta isoform X1 [Mus caroli]XP_021030370.1 cAMP-dependent protein kinase inhibitor beta isoform X1 [Mus caroli]XP_021030371.1 cAMP-dependent protein kinase inhibitor beta isoform X1 [Mus caroli]
MDKNTDAPGGQKKTKETSMGGGSPEAQQDSVMRTDSSEMTDVESVITSFASSARAGRRNALPDIQSSLATSGSSDLPLKLEALAVKEDAKTKNDEKDQGQPKTPLNEGK